MGKRGPKKGQGGRPHGGKHSEEQRCEWRLRKTESERKRAMRETERKQLHKALKTAAAELESANTYFSILNRFEQIQKEINILTNDVKLLKQQKFRKKIVEHKSLLKEYHRLYHDNIRLKKLVGEL